MKPYDYIKLDIGRIEQTGDNLDCGPAPDFWLLSQCTEQAKPHNYIWTLMPGEFEQTDNLINLSSCDVPLYR